MSTTVSSDPRQGSDEELTRTLLESEERLRFAVEAGKMAIWEVDLDTGMVTPNAELNAMFGFPQGYKPSLAELRSRYAPGELERIGRIGASWEVVKELVSKGQLLPRPLVGTSRSDDATQVSADLSIIVPPNIKKHLLYRAQYVYSPQGRPRITGFLIDMTEKRRAENQLAAVANELRHRVKNSFTVVKALARQTFVKDMDCEAALESFLGRVQALSVANDLVLDAEAATTDLRDVVAKITAPYSSIEVEGPSIALAAQAVTAVSMILHELCTNALKYGGLSSPVGHVSLKWSASGKSGMVLEWKESGGPPVNAPEREGFGTRLLRRMVADSLSGTIDLHYHPAGFHCRISTDSHYPLR
jgi:two-component sensor histidine kinase